MTKAKSINKVNAHSAMVKFENQQLHKEYMCKDRSIYFSSFVSFFFGLTLATVSRTAWSVQKGMKKDTLASS